MVRLPRRGWHCAASCRLREWSAARNDRGPASTGLCSTMTEARRPAIPHETGDLPMMTDPRPQPLPRFKGSRSLVIIILVLALSFQAG